MGAVPLLGRAAARRSGAVPHPAGAVPLLGRGSERTFAAATRARAAEPGGGRADRRGRRTRALKISVATKSGGSGGRGR
eukprot:13262155-Heterocapsa_arctica.AAC.1